MARTSVYTDDFSSALSGWDQLDVYGSGGSITVGSGVATGAGNTVGSWAFVCRNTGTYSNDQYAKIKFSYASSGYSTGGVIAVRCSGDVNTSFHEMDYYGVEVNDASGSPGDHLFSVVKVVAGVRTVLGGTSWINVSNGASIEIETEGTTIRFLINGTEQFTRTDSDLTSGRPAFGLSTGGLTADDFEGGTLGSSAITTTVAAAVAVRGQCSASPVQGTLTTSTLKNNTGTVLANESGATVCVYNVSTGALVVKKTGQTTNSSGVMTVADASITPATEYRVVITLGSGAEGMDKLTAT